mmetsp:Transcript_3900/g.8513  ORF Transcript_3900/g.8513 Transcript_3900/m.8513 type:complete len:457 (+) Transcript_3900:2-1372(+)
MRVARVFRFVRVMRCVELLEDLSDLVFSEMLRALLAVCNMLFLVGLLCHYIACSWYAIGKWSRGFEPEGWIDALDEVDAGTLHRYLVCFHWAWAQFTPAPPPTYSTPTNVAEEVFAVVLLFFGLVMFSSFVGSVTATITNARRLSEERKLEAVLLRRYFSDNKVSIRTGNKVLKYVKMQQHKRTGVLESDVKSLCHLPHSMMNDLRVEVFEPVLSQHPLFRQLKRMHAATLQKLCTTALTEVVLGREDEVIHYGKLAQKMFFVRRGSRGHAPVVMDYFAGPTSVGRRAPNARVRAGSWCCEVSLWLAAGPSPKHGKVRSAEEFSESSEAWRHRGRLVVRQQCEVLELHAPRFRVVAMEHPLAIKDFRRYAEMYIKAMSQDQQDLIDVWGMDQEEMQDIVDRCWVGRKTSLESAQYLIRQVATGFSMSSILMDDHHSCWRSCCRCVRVGGQPSDPDG